MRASRLGQSVVIGAAGTGQEIYPPNRDGGALLGTAFGGVKGRPQLPGMVEDAMKGYIQLAPFGHPHCATHRHRRGFDLMHEGNSIRAVVHS